MTGNAKTPTKVFITEDDMSTVLQRYSATTVLALLQEIAQAPGEEYDWNEMVKNSKTGISNAREYQMLWRHLAYRTELVEELDDEDVEPLDDDSDLDCELEALPTVTLEASADAGACVKVLIASGMPSNSTLANGSTVEAPLTISLPKGQSARAPSEYLHPSTLIHGTNITVPVCVPKLSLPAVTTPTPATAAEGSDSRNLPPRRKSKKWTNAEDLKLIAAVKRCGEGTWANISESDFKSERSASQLSHRWKFITKRKDNSNVRAQSNLSLGGKGNSSLRGKVNSALEGSSQLSEAQLAARQAMSLALNMPLTDKMRASSSRGGTTSTPKTSTTMKLEPERQREYELHPAKKQRPEMLLPPSKVDSVTTTPAQRSGVSGAPQRSNVRGLSKSLVNLSTFPTKPSSDEMVKATAVAAGARIVTPSDAASLLKTSGNSLPSNVHYIRTGLATTLPSYSSAPSNDLRLKPPGAAHHSNHQRQTSPKLTAAESETKEKGEQVPMDVDENFKCRCEKRGY